MKRIILGTAGHIDHGKTALVRALTGVDTDRLREEKERGITIDLGFAELADAELRLGVVDVPGHEGFIRNMVAGATGMDIVVVVVAADESVMPQTREHLAIVRLLGVERVVVALTKADLVEEAWLELVREEVAEVMAEHGLPDAPIVVTSAETARGIDALTRRIRDAAASSPDHVDDDVARLPVDRVFTVRGTGTVVTGTLWSGTLRKGGEVRIRPAGVAARIRGLQVHGREVEEARAGERTAVALAGSGVDREALTRGDVLLDSEAWPASYMLTVRARILEDVGWSLEHNQRVRVHLGTAEVMARTVVLEPGGVLPAGGEGWIQLRLEAPAIARSGDRVVLRAYSPVTTIGGGRVAEPLAPKRSSLGEEERDGLDRILTGETALTRIEALLDLAGWEGVAVGELPVRTGSTPADVGAAVDRLVEEGGATVGDRLLGPTRIAHAAELVEASIRSYHEEEPLRPGMPLHRLRASLPGGAPEGLADHLVRRSAEAERLVVTGEHVREAGFRPTPDPRQEEVREELAKLYRASGVTPVAVDGLPDRLREDPDLWALLRLLEADGILTMLEDGVFVDTRALREAAERVGEELAGRSGLGPTDFKEVIPVSRRHLIPILGWLDQEGITLRSEGGRSVL